MTVGVEVEMPGDGDKGGERESGDDGRGESVVEVEMAVEESRWRKPSVLYLATTSSDGG